MIFSEINNSSLETEKSKRSSFDIDKRAEMSENSDAKGNEGFDIDKRAETTKDDIYNEAKDFNQSENIEKNIEDYINDIKNRSEYPDTLDDIEINCDDMKKISPEENAEMREEFSDKKAELKRQWEEKNGIPWPKYEEDVYSEKGKLIRQKGDDYDVHHVHPLGLGGKNTVENITPMHASEHYDKQGVHAPNSPYDKLQKSFV